MYRWPSKSGCFWTLLLAEWAEPAFGYASLRRLYYCEGGNLIELRNAWGQPPSRPHPLSFSLSSLFPLPFSSCGWRRAAAAGKGVSTGLGDVERVGLYVCMRRPLEKSWGWGDEGAGYFCVCIHFLGEGSSVIFGRKWRLMIMRTMLLTSPATALCMLGQRKCGGGESFLSPVCVGKLNKSYLLSVSPPSWVAARSSQVNLA